MTSKRIYAFDFLNVFSCISVVALHCNNVYHGYSHSASWIYSAIIQVLFFCAVPNFFMLTGSTLLNYRERYSTKLFFTKRFKRVLIPYFFFSVVLILFQVILNLKNNVPFNWKSFIRGGVTSMLTGNLPFAEIYWFFIPLLMIYLLLPILSIFTSNSSKILQLYFILILIFFQSIWPLAMYFFHLPQLYFPVGGYVLYVLLGWYLTEYKLEENKIFLISIGILAIACFGLRLFFILKYAYSEIPILRDYFGLYSLIPSIALFIYAKKFLGKNEKHLKFYNFVSVLSGLSFGVYLIHNFFIRIIGKYFGYENFYLQTIGVLTIYIVCCCIVYITKKIKFLRWIFP